MGVVWNLASINIWLNSRDCILELFSQLSISFVSQIDDELVCSFVRFELLQCLACNEVSGCIFLCFHLLACNDSKCSLFLFFTFSRCYCTPIKREFHPHRTSWVCWRNTMQNVLEKVVNIKLMTTPSRSLNYGNYLPTTQTHTKSHYPTYYINMPPPNTLQLFFILTGAGFSSLIAASRALRM